MTEFHMLVLIIVITLIFEFTNGWHDAASSIATVVSTRVLRPMWAVIWAAFWNFVAAFAFGTAVAKTMGSGLVDLKMVDQTVAAGGIAGCDRLELRDDSHGAAGELVTCADGGVRRRGDRSVRIPRDLDTRLDFAGCFLFSWGRLSGWLWGFW